MGRLINNLGGGGGGTSSDEVTATRYGVLEPYTAVTKDSNDEPVEGLMPDRRKPDPEIGGVTSDFPNIGIHKYEGTAQVVTPTNQNSKWVALSPPEGFYQPASSYIGIPQSELATALGVTPQKIAYKNTILGIAGTNTGAGTANQEDVLEGKTFSAGKDGNTGWYNAPGKMKFVPNTSNITLSTTDGRKVIVQNNKYNSHVWFTKNSDGVNRLLIQCPITGYYNDTTIIGFPITTLYNNAGVVANKVATGHSLLGLTGTYKGLGNATANQVLKGRTFSTASLSNATGTLEVQSALSFKIAAVTVNSVTIAWKNPAKGPYSGVIINMSTSSNGFGSGGNYTWKYTGLGNNGSANGQSSVTITGLNQNTTYYFEIISYCTAKANGAKADLIGGKAYINATTNAKGQQIFTSGGTFTVPARVTKVDVFLVSGGNGGQSSRQSSGDPTSYYSGKGGGGGRTATFKAIPVSPGQQVPVVIGAGGSSYSYTAAEKDKPPGAVSTFGSYSSPSMEYRPDGVKTTDRSYGGSGGGAGSSYDDNDNRGFFCGGHGGSDGSNGYEWNNRYDGYTGRQELCPDRTDYAYGGQRSTTRAFGESGNTLYSGGGGGGAMRTNNGGSGAGGAGGGGSGGDIDTGPGHSGTAGTGGGGGARGGQGGSGVVIVRWGY